MNGINSPGVAPNTATANGPSSSEASNFDELFMKRAADTGVIVLQFIGSDIIESVLKGDDAVD